MALFNYGTLPSWILNPFGNLLHLIDRRTDDHSKDQPLITRGEIDRKVSDIWDDVTGISAIERQNELNRQMAEEEYQRNLQSIGDTAAAYEAAGFNRNLMYGSSPTSYSAPELQAYSGSSKLDTILSRTGKVLNFIPAIYQATAALESIDQARERTKQQEIKTMSDGINLLKNGFGLGDLVHTTPYSFDLGIFRGGKRHVSNITPADFYTHGYSRGHWDSNGKWVPWYSPNELGQYVGAQIQNKIELLKAIGISNNLRRTRNSYLGYQYDLDRRFGAAGKIVGMASQGVGAAAKFLPLNSFFKR